MAEPFQEDPVIKQQQQFVDWLKKGRCIIVHTMNRMFAMWEKFMTEIQEKEIT